MGRRPADRRKAPRESDRGLAVIETVAGGLRVALERTFRIVDRYGAADDDVAWLGRALAQRFGDRPAERRRRRDAAIARYGARFGGPTAGETAKAFEAAALLMTRSQLWRQNRRGEIPLQWRGTPQECVFEFLRESGEKLPLGYRQISRILSNPWNHAETRGQNQLLVLSSESAHPARANSSKGLAMLQPAIKDEEFFEGLRRHPVGREIVAEAQLPRLKQRREQLARLRALDAAEEIAFPKRERAFARALEKWEAAQAAFKKAADELNAAAYEKNGASLAYQGERQALEAALGATADNAAIQAFLSRMLDELDAARKAYQFHAYMVMHPVTREHVRRCDTNGESVQARISAINAAMAAAGELRLEPDQAIVPGRLKALLEGLPPISTDLAPKPSAERGQ